MSAAPLLSSPDKSITDLRSILSPPPGHPGTGSRTRLLFIGLSPLSTNAGQHKLYFIALALARAGWPVTILLPGFPENREFFERHRAPLETIFVPSGIAGLEIARKIFAIQGRKWSAVWAVGLGSRVFTLFGRPFRQPPLIHDFDEIHSLVETLSTPRRLYMRLVEAVMWRRAHGFTCASRYIVNEALRRRPALTSHILHLPVAISADEHQMDPALLAELRQRYAGRPVLLYIGVLYRHFQIGELLDLAAELKRRLSPAVIRVVGDGPDRASFESAANERHLGSHLRFEGAAPREALASHMEAADVLLFPFHDTPFNVARCPTKAYHYAAANRPVVTNRVGEVAALLGESAFYYPEGDAAAMADACDRALAAQARFDNGIPFASLTWESRAAQLASWLHSVGWLPTCSP